MDRDARRNYHLTVNRAIKFLRKLPPGKMVRYGRDRLAPSTATSHLGHDMDVVLAPSTFPASVARIRSVLEELPDSLRDAPLWRDESLAIVNIINSVHGVILIELEVK